MSRQLEQFQLTSLASTVLFVPIQVTRKQFEAMQHDYFYSPTAKITVEHLNNNSKLESPELAHNGFNGRHIVMQIPKG